MAGSALSTTRIPRASIRTGTPGILIVAARRRRRAVPAWRASSLDSTTVERGAPRRPGAAPAIALAIATLLVLVAVLLFAPFRWRAHPAAHPTPNGGVILGWRRAASAETYVVRFLDAQGRTIDSIDGVATLELVLTREALPRHLVPGSTVRWTVTALRRGREVGRSDPESLRLP
jgi:hypothetical protein